MKNRTTLLLMEQIIMVLIFALCAALCLKVFSYSDSVSLKTKASSEAALVLQTTAEKIKMDNGTDNKIIYYDVNWNETDEDSKVYQVEIKVLESEIKYLGKANLQASDKNGVLFELPVCWQEVADNE